MERLAPYLLLLVGMGAAYLAIGGLVRLRPERSGVLVVWHGSPEPSGSGARCLWSPRCCCFWAIRLSAADQFSGCSIPLNLSRRAV